MGLVSRIQEEEIPFVKIGVTKKWNDVKYYLKKPPMLGILGSSQSGKSNFLMSFILQLARYMGPQVQFIGIDAKNGGSLNPVQSRFYSMCYESTDALQVLQEFEVLMSKRLKHIQENVEDEEPKIDVFDPNFPMIVLVVEELVSLITAQELSKSQRDKLGEMFVTITSRCRAANIGFILSSQTFNEKYSIPTAVRGNFLEKVILQQAENIVKVFDEDAKENAPAWTLKGEGEFYFKQLGTDYQCCKCWFLPAKVASKTARELSGDVAQNLDFGWTPECPFS